MSTQQIEAGKAVVRLSLKDELTKSLKNVQRRLNAFSASAAAMGTQFLAVGSAISAGFYQSVQAASSMEETMNKFNVMFGSNSDEIKRWGDNLADEMGRSKTEIAKFLSNAQATLVPLGIDPKKAEEMSKTMASLSYDLASFNDIESDEDAFESFRKGITGSAEMLDKFSMKVDDNMMKQKAASMGFDPKNLTNAQKIMARYELVLEQASAAMGDVARSQGSYNNETKRMKAAISDAMVTIGQAVLPTVAKIATSVASVIKSFGEWAEQNQGMVQLLAILGASLIAIGTALIAAATMAYAFSGAISFATMAMTAFNAVSTFSSGKLGLVTKAFTVAFTACTSFTGALSALRVVLIFITGPIGWAIAAISLIGWAIYAFVTSSKSDLQAFSDFFIRIWETISATAQKGYNYIKKLFDWDFDVSAANKKIDEAVEKAREARKKAREEMKKEEEKEKEKENKNEKNEAKKPDTKPVVNKPKPKPGETYFDRNGMIRVAPKDSPFGDSELGVKEGELKEAVNNRDKPASESYDSDGMVIDNELEGYELENKKALEEGTKAAFANTSRGTFNPAAVMASLQPKNSTRIYEQIAEHTKQTAKNTDPKRQRNKEATFN